jgi:hypothetical protein
MRAAVTVAVRHGSGGLLLWDGLARRRRDTGDSDSRAQGDRGADVDGGWRGGVGRSAEWDESVGAGGQVLFPRVTGGGGYVFGWDVEPFVQLHVQVKQALHVQVMQASPAGSPGGCHRWGLEWCFVPPLVVWLPSRWSRFLPRAGLGSSLAGWVPLARTREY